MNVENKPKRLSDWLLILLTGLLLASSFWLRLASLGYSNLPGDEVKSLCQPAAGQSLVDFLLDQRKGPVQYLITCVNRVFDPGLTNQLALRLPFAVANLLAVFVLFLLVRRHFNRSVALYAALFMATNGLIVAFGRIVQYQSITILCTLLALYCFTRAVQDEKWKVVGLYLGSFAAAVGILAHFDGFFALPPMGYLAYEWWKKYRPALSLRGDLRYLLAAGGVFALLLAAFYVPYALHLNAYQLDYWQQRLTGASRNTLGLFRFYDPGPIIWIYFLLIVLGATRLRLNPASLLLASWLIPPLVFIEFVMSDPRTHFYTYLLPLIILAALGIETVRLGLSRLLRRDLTLLVQAGCVVLFAFLFTITNVILVDHNPEYPWQSKTFLNMTFPGGDIQGAFGFPYRRPWSEIAGWFAQTNRLGADYTTNEKLSITSFYMPQNMQYKEIDQDYYDQMGEQSGIYIVMVENPQSRVQTLWGLTVNEVNQKVRPEIEFFDEDGKLQATIYYLTKEQINLLYP